MTKEEETAVVRAVLDGEIERFEELVLAHQRGVYNLALRLLGNEQDALDAAQESFFRAYRSLPGFRQESTFRVWLFRLANNVCLDMLRRRPAAPPVPLETEESGELPIPDERFRPDVVLEEKELRRAVRHGLAELEPEFRYVLELRELSGLAYDEIAQVTGVGVGTVKSRIFRARKKLAAILLRSGNFSEAAPSVLSDGEGAQKGGVDK